MKQFKISVIALITGIFLMLSLASCDKEDTDHDSKNLVIVTDNDPGSYIMVKILGEVRSSFPDIHITYLQSKQFDVYEGAFLMSTAYKSFPAGTVIAGIIEPGANSKRIVFRAGDQLILSPDNSLATLILHDNTGAACYYIENTSVLGGAQPDDLSFEDFYASAICSLISGIPEAGFGTACNSPVTFPVQEPVLNGNSISGQVLFVDNFGNCLTNIPDSLVASLALGTVFTLTADTIQTDLTLGTTYSSVPTGNNVCFINSSKLMELAINYGNFSDTYQLTAGSRFQMTH
jgi:S-adenosyl-L-methionine hydrolase (adenosine-forming)